MAGVLQISVFKMIARLIIDSLENPLFLLFISAGLALVLGLYWRQYVATVSTVAGNP